MIHHLNISHSNIVVFIGYNDAHTRDFLEAFMSTQESKITLLINVLMTEFGKVDGVHLCDLSAFKENHHFKTIEIFSQKVVSFEKLNLVLRKFPFERKKPGKLDVSLIERISVQISDESLKCWALDWNFYLAIILWKIVEGNVPLSSDLFQESIYLIDRALTEDCINRSPIVFTNTNNFRKRKVNWDLGEQDLKSILNSEKQMLPLPHPFIDFLGHLNQEEDVESDSDIISILKSEKLLKPKFPDFNLQIPAQVISRYQAVENYVVYLQNIYSQREHKLKLFVKYLKSKVQQEFYQSCQFNKLNYQKL